jgi:hypothetical protein
MKTTSNNLINNYFVLLKSLSSDDKLELIAKLSQSMESQSKEMDTDKSWLSLFGALELEIPVEEFLADIKIERNFHDKSFEL